MPAPLAVAATKVQLASATIPSPLLPLYIKLVDVWGRLIIKYYTQCN